MRKVPGLLMCALLLAGCAANRHSQWTDADATEVAPGLATDILQGGWVGEYAAREGRLPSLLLDGIDSRTPEPVSLNALKQELTRQLLSSGKIGLVLSREPDSAATDSLDPGKTVGESGADLVLTGWLDAFPVSGAVIYQFTVFLRDAEDQSLVRQSVFLHRKPHRPPRDAGA